MYLPIIGAFLEALGTILTKKTLKLKGVNYKNYTIYGFLAIVIVMLPFIYFVWKIDEGAYSFRSILIMFFVVVFSIVANFLVFYSLKREDVTEFEPAWLMQPLFTVLLAFIVFKDERNWIILILAFIASLSLVLSHVKRHHLSFNKYFFAVILGSFFFSVELVLSKLILEYYSPFSFYFVRCFFVFLFTAIIFRKNLKIKGIQKKAGIYILITGLLWVFYRAIVYYAYGSIGIVFTTLLFILSPVFLFAMAIVFLKEKPRLRHIISTIIIVICIVLSFILTKWIIID